MEWFGQVGMRGQAKKRVPKGRPWAGVFFLEWATQRMERRKKETA
jgi:hypothetical protein